MRYSKEMKVGTAIILSVLILVFGIRFFGDLPLFKGTYSLKTSFTDAGGLLVGASVRVNGVDVGKVDRVVLNPETQIVDVDFHVDGEMKIPQGSYTSIEGIEALGSVLLGLTLGPSDAARIEEDGFVPSRPETDALGDLMEQGPALLGSADSVLADTRTALLAATVAMQSANALLSSPNSDLMRTFAELRAASAQMNQILAAEQARLSAVMTNLEGFSGNLNAFSETNMDSLALAVQNLNSAMVKVNGNLDSFQRSADSLSVLVSGINAGEGTVGMLLKDPSLYNRLDSAATGMNDLMRDFQQHPSRYLRHLTLVKLF